MVGGSTVSRDPVQPGAGTMSGLSRKVQTCDVSRNVQTILTLPLYLVELSKNLREVSKCPEKAPTRALSSGIMVG